MIGLDLISQFRSIEASFRDSKEKAGDVRREELTTAQENLGVASIEAHKHLNDVRVAQYWMKFGFDQLSGMLPSEAPGGSAAAGGSDFMTGAVQQFKTSVNRCIDGLSVEPGELSKQAQELTKKAAKLRRA